MLIKNWKKNGFIFSKRGSGSYVAEQVINTIDELEENNHIPIDLTDDLKILQGQKNVINMSTISLNPDMISIETFKQVVNKNFGKRQRICIYISRQSRLFATSPIDYSRISEKKDKYNARIHSDYFRCATRHRYSSTCYFKNMEILYL